MLLNNRREHVITIQTSANIHSTDFVAHQKQLEIRITHVLPSKEFSVENHDKHVYKIFDRYMKLTHNNKINSLLPSVTLRDNL